MKRFLSFVLSFAVMFSMFAPSAYALENTPSVLTLDEEDTIRVYYKVNDSLEYKDIANREIELTDNDVVELIADDLSTGEMVEIEQITFNPSGYSTASISGGSLDCTATRIFICSCSSSNTASVIVSGSQNTMKALSGYCSAS